MRSHGAIRFSRRHAKPAGRARKRPSAARHASRRASATYGWLAFTIVVRVAGIAAPPAHAQLISPGSLSRAHQDLEGIRNCTSCHTLGNKGIDPVRCLTCHEPLKARLDARTGFHATVADQNCTACHKEHFGKTFQLVRFDTTRFDHKDTGFTLTGSHRQVACRTCHQPAFIVARDVRIFKTQHGALDRTFLGLGTRCLSCHEPDSPHAGQFAGGDCTTCHTTEQWEEAGAFDHNKAPFTLTGRHQQVACRDCHRRETPAEALAFTRYEGLAFATCTACHNDAHNGAFGVTCAECHTPTGWHQIQNFAEDRFDHTTTGFDLVGQHAGLDCGDCHAKPARRDASIRLTFVRGTERRTYPKIQGAECLSCHVDYHAQVFEATPGGTNCTNCHTQNAWVPITYDLDRHTREARFALTGAHLATPCGACHGGGTTAPVFRFDDLDCQECHTTDNPHADQFADDAGTTACDDCHTTDGWAFGPTFDHSRTDFALRGRHVEVACDDCHTTPQEGVVPYRNLPADCAGCHASDDPHQDQFAGQPCEACHDVEGFQTASTRFDHSGTRFPLEGAHRDAACGRCHKEAVTPDGIAFIRYRPLGIACKDCHSGG